MGSSVWGVVPDVCLWGLPAVARRVGHRSYQPVVVRFCIAVVLYTAAVVVQEVFSKVGAVHVLHFIAEVGWPAGTFAARREHGEHRIEGATKFVLEENFSMRGTQTLWLFVAAASPLST